MKLYNVFKILHSDILNLLCFQTKLKILSVALDQYPKFFVIVSIIYVHCFHNKYLKDSFMLKHKCVGTR